MFITREPNSPRGSIFVINYALGDKSAGSSTYIYIYIRSDTLRGKQNYKSLREKFFAAIGIPLTNDDNAVAGG